MADVRWQWISAGRNLKGDDERYVRRPVGAGDDLADLVRRGISPIAVTGPPGTGKTTELLRASWSTRKRSQNLTVHVNWFADTHEVEPGRFIYHLARHFFEEWVNDVTRTPPKVALVQDMRASDPDLAQGAGRTLPPGVMARQVFAGYANAYNIERFALFLDGVDQVPTERARSLLHKLLEIRDVADFTVVVGPELTNGPASVELLRNYRLFVVPPLATGPRSPGRGFLEDLALRRLGIKGKPSRAIKNTLGRAAAYSGGLPHRFLALLTDAAKLTDRANPSAKKVDTAADQHAVALRRLLIKGDRATLLDAEGSPGIEVDPDRRIRLIAQALLLETIQDGEVVVQPHPLLRRYLDQL